MQKETGLLERVFHLSENGTSVKTEIMAGITTFMTMAYILAVNPAIMSAAGMDKGAVLTATAIAGFLGTVLMAVFSNYPFALAPGMGLNAFFAFTVVKQMGYTWEMALAAVFVEGVIFIVLSLTNVREAIFNAIPLNLKKAVSAGIGLFICFIGLTGAQIIVGNPATKISLFSFKQAMLAGTFHTTGITVVLAILGVLFTAFLMVAKVRGNILWGILFTWILGILCEVSGLYVPDPAHGAFSTLPNLSAGLASFAPASISPLIGELDFSQVATFNFVVVLLAFLFVDIFDTLGTLIGVSSKANMLDKDGNVPNVSRALMADAVATTAGAALGTSTVTTFVESSTGVSAGGRTGYTAITIGVLFLVAMFFSPIFIAIPSCATAPALIYVGYLMLGAAKNIEFDNITEGLPAFITIAAMPLTYSIGDGLILGVLSYVLVNLLYNVMAPAEKRKKVSVVMIVLAILFILKFWFGI